MIQFLRCTPFLSRLTVAAMLLAPGLITARPAHAAAFVVTNLNDSGVGSLRAAMLSANAAGGADTITFSVRGTITLASALPDITDAAGLTIDGSGQAVVVSGDKKVRPLRIAAGALLNLSNLAVIEGFSGSGGAIRNLGRLNADKVTITGSFASEACTDGLCEGIGGGIRNEGTLVLLGSVLVVGHGYMGDTRWGGARYLQYETLHSDPPRRRTYGAPQAPQGRERCRTSADARPGSPQG
ncbi:MAG: hypothetical protein EXR52_05295 [Dehalococcoidia bacterium]|nr:hypothetical protein [Dehalococcoidia bacterium]